LNFVFEVEFFATAFVPTFWSAEFEFPWLFGVLNFAIAQALWLAVDVYSDWINRRLDGNKEPV
jgi:hypothetical protein